MLIESYAVAVYGGIKASKHGFRKALRTCLKMAISIYAVYRWRGAGKSLLQINNECFTVIMSGCHIQM